MQAVLKEAERQDKQRANFNRRGIDLRWAAREIAREIKIEERSLFLRGRTAEASKAKAMLIYLGIEVLGQSRQEMAEMTRMSGPAATKAKERGFTLFAQSALAKTSDSIALLRYSYQRLLILLMSLMSRRLRKMSIPKLILYCGTATALLLNRLGVLANDPLYQQNSQKANNIARRRIPDQVKALLTRGEKFYGEGNLLDARLEFEAVLLLEPNNTRAQKFLRVIETAFQSVVESFYRDGIMSMAKEDYDLAIKQFKTALSIDPSHSNAKTQLKKCTDKAMSNAGMLEAGTTVELQFQTEGKISLINIAEGDKVKAGQILAQLDQTQALSLLETRRKEDARYKSLFTLIGEPLAAKEAERKFKEAQLELEKTILKAPCTGVINKILVSVGDKIKSESIIATMKSKD